MTPPIAESKATPKKHLFRSGVRLFRMKFWPYFLWTTLSSLALVGPILAWIIFPVFAFHPERFAPAMGVVVAGMTVGAFFFCALLRWLAPIRVSRWGLRAFSYWGSAREVAWSQMASVRFAWSLCSYLVVELANGRKLWIIWPLQNPRGFAKAVASHTAPDRPLRQFLERRVGDH